MPRARYTQPTFAAGEFDPLLSGREDLENYFLSAARLENVIALPQGPLAKRPGMRPIHRLDRPHLLPDGTAINLFDATYDEDTPIQLIEWDPVSSMHRVLVVLTDRTAVFLDAEDDGEVLATMDLSASSSGPRAMLADGETWSVISYLDSLLLLHPSGAPVQLRFRSDDRDMFLVDRMLLPFEALPQFAFPDSPLATGLVEEQEIRLSGYERGNRIAIELGGEVVDGHISTAPVTAIALQGLIRSLPNGPKRATVGLVEQVDHPNETYRIVFGVRTERDDLRPWPLLVVSTLEAPDSAIATVNRTQLGRPARENLWSDRRGWPSTGTFYQGRLWLGGAVQSPDVIASSRAGSFFDFAEDREPIASSPIVVRLDLDEAVNVRHIHPGRNLQVFTDRLEIFFPDEPITPENVSAKIASRHGTSTRPVDIEGATFFIDRNGEHLREFVYSDAVENYTAEPVSSLAPHLIKGTRWIARVRGASSREPERLILGRGAGDPATVCVFERSQNVTAFSRIVTAGIGDRAAAHIMAATGGRDSEAWFVVQRAEAFGPVIERWRDDLGLDAVQDVTASSSGEVQLPAAWADTDVWVIRRDGRPIAAFTADGRGRIALGDDWSGDAVAAGLAFMPRVVMHPYRARGAPSPVMVNQRIFRAYLSFERTGQAVITVGGERWEVPTELLESTEADSAFEDLLFTGERRMSGFGRWEQEPRIEIGQTVPLPWTLKWLNYDIRF